ncbi:MAG: serine hydrolase domain-containing protein [Ferruginibacter sp.]
MAFIGIRDHYLTVRVFIILLCYVAINTSCNSAVTAEKNNKDSITALRVQSPGFVSAEDSVKIYSACLHWYDTVLKPRGFNGGMIVAKNGKVIFEQYNGTGHIPGSDTITANTPLHIASITKTFSAMAVLKLMQDGKLNLDDEFSKYFPAFNYPGVTISSLLNHRSGLPNYNYFMQALGWDEHVYVSNQDVLNYLITRKAELVDVLTPNTHFSYCNTNYALLALLIEKVSEQTYSGYLKQTFFTPLQMKNTYVFSLADTATATPSYNWRGKPETLNFLDQVYGDKNIYTTPHDLLIWDRALSSNIIFTDETLQLAYAPYSNEKPGMRNYGLGWRMNIFPDGNKIIYHNGWWHGSNATFIRLLKEQATIIVIGNKFNRAIYHAKILTSLFGNYYSPVDEELAETVKDSLPVYNTVIQTDTLQKLKADKPKQEVKNKLPAMPKKN